MLNPSFCSCKETSFTISAVTLPNLFRPREICSRDCAFYKLICACLQAFIMTSLFITLIQKPVVKGWSRWCVELYLLSSRNVSVRVKCPFYWCKQMFLVLFSHPRLFISLFKYMQLVVHLENQKCLFGFFSNFLSVTTLPTEFVLKYTFCIYVFHHLHKDCL